MNITRTIRNMNADSIGILNTLIDFYRTEDNEAVADSLEHAKNMLEIMNENA